MRAQGDSATNPLRAEPVWARPVEDCRTHRRLTADAPDDWTAAGEGCTEESVRPRFLLVLLRALSAWPT
jgi:hypothetical protein